jgi:hypothetical protein
LSKKSGHPYKDRWGVDQNTEAEQLGITKAVLQQWCVPHGEEFDVA